MTSVTQKELSWLSPLISTELIHKLKVTINLTILRALPLLHFTPCFLIASMSFNIMEGPGATYKSESDWTTVAG
jgi:hypothetical protein